MAKLKPVTPSAGLGDGSSRFGRKAAVCKVTPTQWPNFCAYIFILEKDLYVDVHSRPVLMIKT